MKFGLEVPPIKKPIVADCKNIEEDEIFAVPDFSLNYCYE
jgi:hypothetical protein